jgi:hypothetical protein
VTVTSSARQERSVSDVRTPIKKVEQARRELANGTCVLKTAKLVGLGTGTVQRLRQSMAVA